MTFAEIKDSMVAVWLVTEQHHGSFEHSWFAGSPLVTDGRFCISRGQDEPFCLPLDALDDVQRANDAQRDVFEGSEFFIRLVIKLLPEDVDRNDLEFTGLKLE